MKKQDNLNENLARHETRESRIMLIGWNKRVQDSRRDVSLGEVGGGGRECFSELGNPAVENPNRDKLLFLSSKNINP